MNSQIWSYSSSCKGNLNLYPLLGAHFYIVFIVCCSLWRRFSFHFMLSSDIDQRYNIVPYSSLLFCIHSVYIKIVRNSNGLLSWYYFHQNCLTSWSILVPDHGRQRFIRWKISKVDLKEIHNKLFSTLMKMRCAWNNQKKWIRKMQKYKAIRTNRSSDLKKTLHLKAGNDRYNQRLCNHFLRVLPPCLKDKPYWENSHCLCAMSFYLKSPPRRSVNVNSEGILCDQPLVMQSTHIMAILLTYFSHYEDG